MLTRTFLGVDPKKEIDATRRLPDLSLHLGRQQFEGAAARHGDAEQGCEEISPLEARGVVDKDEDVRKLVARICRLKLSRSLANVTAELPVCWNVLADGETAFVRGVE
jgi:hypothetical protein